MADAQMPTLKLKKKERRRIIGWALDEATRTFVEIHLKTGSDAELDALLRSHAKKANAVLLIEEVREGSVKSQRACRTLIKYAKEDLETADLFFGRAVREHGPDDPDAQRQLRRGARIAAILHKAKEFDREITAAEEDAEDLAAGMTPEEIAVAKEAWQAYLAINGDDEEIADAVSAMLRKDSDWSVEAFNALRRETAEGHRRLDSVVDKALSLVRVEEVAGD